MARSVGAELPSDLFARLSQAELSHHLGKVLPLVTLDPEGRPHPMLLSSLEVRARDRKTVRIVIGAGSQSARNLLERRAATLLIVELERTVYVKTRVTDGPYPVAGLAALSLFGLTVEEVLEDAPADWETGMKIAGSLTYAPVPSLDQPWVRTILDALAE